MLKLIVLGTLGYAAYRTVQRAIDTRSDSQPRLAGGPLSRHATVQSNPNVPPGTY